MIEANRFQPGAHRADARERLLELIRTAAQPPKPRKPTRPSKGSKERRLQAKRERAQVKQSRTRRVTRDD